MKDRLFYSICFGLILFFGVFKVVFFPIHPPEILENTIGQKIAFEGLVVDEPDKRENNQKLVVQIKESTFDTKVLITSSLYDEFKYGDIVSVYGKLVKLENFITDTGKEFDYVHYLAKDNIHYLVNYPEIKIVLREQGNPIKGFLFSAKEKFLEKINYAIPEPESLLMGGLIFGQEANFSQEMRQDFVDTGTIHIVALSGYNVTIVAEWIMKLFGFLPLIYAVWVGILAIFLFIIMSGGASTAVRAGIMASLVLIARSTGRNYDISRALVIAATLMIILNPMIFLYDVSFQLSFIATVAVIYLSPRLEKYFTWVTKSFGLRDIISVTFSAYIFVLPFILYKMGNLSVVALPANFLVLPFIPFTMVLGFITGFIGFISPFISLIFGYIAYLFLGFELKVIHLFSNFSFASITVSNFPIVLTILIYLYFIYFLFGKNIVSIFKKNL